MLSMFLSFARKYDGFIPKALATARIAVFEEEGTIK